MKCLTMAFGTLLVGLITLISSPANAIEYECDFSQSGWIGGGEITGSFVIDNSVPTQTGLLGQNALLTFQAHWTGNTYTQPFDWGINDLHQGLALVWDPNQLAVVDLVLGETIGMDIVPYYDAFNEDGGLIWDDRSGHVDPGTGELDRYRTMDPLIASVRAVPDGGNTLVLLAFVLPLLALAKVKNSILRELRGKCITLRRF